MQQHAHIPPLLHVGSTAAARPYSTAACVREPPCPTPPGTRTHAYACVYTRSQASQWFCTVSMFFAFVVLVHSTLWFGDGSGGDGSGGGSDYDEAGAAGGAGGPIVDVMMLVFALAAKIFLVVIPIFCVAALTARQAARAHQARMLHAGADELTRQIIAQWLTQGGGRTGRGAGGIPMRAVGPNTV